MRLYDGIPQLSDTQLSKATIIRFQQFHAPTPSSRNAMAVYVTSLYVPNFTINTNYISRKNDMLGRSLYLLFHSATWM